MIFPGSPSPVMTFPADPALHLCTSEDHLVKFVYHPHIYDQTTSVQQNIIMCRDQTTADFYNDLVMKHLPATPIGSIATYTHLPATPTNASVVDGVGTPAIDVEDVQPASAPYHSLVIKVGAIYEMTASVSQDPSSGAPGLHRGARVVVVVADHDSGVLIVKSEGSPADTTWQLNRVAHILDLEGRTVYRVQYPIRPAYAVTFRRGQGRSYAVCGIDATHPGISIIDYELTLAIQRRLGAHCMARVLIEDMPSSS